MFYIWLWYIFQKVKLAVARRAGKSLPRSESYVAVVELVEPTISVFQTVSDRKTTKCGNLSRSREHQICINNLKKQFEDRDREFLLALYLSRHPEA